MFYLDSTDDADDGTAGVRFTYVDVPDSGAVATLDCSEEVGLLIMYQDRSGYVLEYEVEEAQVGGEAGNKAASGKIRLPRDKAAKPVSGKAVAKGLQGRRLKSSRQVDIHDESDTGLSFDYDTPGDAVLVQVELKKGSQTLYRSIIAETRPPPPDVATLELESAVVNQDGNVDLYFGGIPDTSSSSVLLKAMIAIEVAGKGLVDQVALSAMANDGHLVLHGGWVRNALEKAGTTGSVNGWRVSVVEAVALDPEALYQKVAELSGKRDSTVAKNKQLLSRKPSVEERNISEEMKMGRRPVSDERHLRSRGLATGSKKILAYGYW